EPVSRILVGPHPLSSPVRLIIEELESLGDSPLADGAWQRLDLPSIQDPAKSGVSSSVEGELQPDPVLPAGWIPNGYVAHSGPGGRSEGDVGDLSAAFAEHGDAEVSLKWRWCTDGEELVKLRLFRVEPDSPSLQVPTVQQLGRSLLDRSVSLHGEDLAVRCAEH